MTVALAWPSAAFAQDAKAADKAWRAGFKAFQDGNPGQCIAKMRAALKAGGEVYERWGWLHKTLGICLAQRRQHGEAISELQVAKELVSEEVDRFEVNHGLAQVYIARGNPGDYDRAIASENEAAKYASGSRREALVAKTLGQAYYYSEDWGKAIQYLELSVASRSADADATMKLGIAYQRSGDLAEARRYLEQARALHPGPDVAQLIESVLSELGSGAASGRQTAGLPPGAGAMASYSGNGTRNVRPFTVRDEWEIQWNATGDIFQVTLYDANTGEIVDILANQSGPGPGSSYVLKGGRYYLSVNAMGDWEVRIVQLGQEPH